VSVSEPVGVVLIHVTDALARQKISTPPSVSWVSKPMRAKVDLADKDALYAALGEQ
jgi:hypothetical protein